MNVDGVYLISKVILAKDSNYFDPAAVGIYHACPYCYKKIRYIYQYIFSSRSLTKNAIDFSDIFQEHESFIDNPESSFYLQIKTVKCCIGKTQSPLNRNSLKASLANSPSSQLAKQHLRFYLRFSVILNEIGTSLQQGIKNGNSRTVRVVAFNSCLQTIFGCEPNDWMMKVSAVPEIMESKNSTQCFKINAATLKNQVCYMKLAQKSIKDYFEGKYFYFSMNTRIIPKNPSSMEYIESRIDPKFTATRIYPVSDLYHDKAAKIFDTYLSNFERYEHFISRMTKKLDVLPKKGSDFDTNLDTDLDTDLDIDLDFDFGFEEIGTLDSDALEDLEGQSLQHLSKFTSNIGVNGTTSPAKSVYLSSKLDTGNFKVDCDSWGTQWLNFDENEIDYALTVRSQVSTPTYSEFDFSQLDLSGFDSASTIERAIQDGLASFSPAFPQILTSNASQPLQRAFNGEFDTPFAASILEAYEASGVTISQIAQESAGEVKKGDSSDILKKKLNPDGTADFSNKQGFAIEYQTNKVVYSNADKIPSSIESVYFDTPNLLNSASWNFLQEPITDTPTKMPKRQFKFPNNPLHTKQSSANQEILCKSAQNSGKNGISKNSEYISLNPNLSSGNHELKIQQLGSLTSSSPKLVHFFGKKPKSEYLQQTDLALQKIAPWLDRQNTLSSKASEQLEFISPSNSLVPSSRKKSTKKKRPNQKLRTSPNIHNKSRKSTHKNPKKSSLLKNEKSQTRMIDFVVLKTPSPIFKRSSLQSQIYNLATGDVIVPETDLKAKY